MKFGKEIAMLFKSAIVSSLVFIPWSQSQAEEIGTPLNKLYAEDGIAGKVTSVGNLPIESLNSKVSVSAASLQIIPASSTTVTNCIPFGNNTYFGFTGFIYRNVPAFNLPAGAKIRFDLGRLNTQDTRRNIFFGKANKNPAPGVWSGHNVISQNITVDTSGWKQVVSENQIPLNSKGNTISGDYELTYIAEAPFSFTGGGLLIGFQGSPPSKYADNNCEQVLVSTNTKDASGNFYARFCGKSDLSTDILDIGCGGTGVALGGFILDDLFNYCLGLTCTINGKPSEIIIHGTNDDDVICGTDKDDIILGKDGHDTICGGAGNDVILAGNGHDRVEGGTGNDVIDGGTGMDMLDGGSDNDVLLGGNNGDLLYGGVDFDHLSGGRGQDMLNGGPDHDICEQEKSHKLLVSCENKIPSTNTSVLTLDNDLVSPELSKALDLLRSEIVQ